MGTYLQKTNSSPSSQRQFTVSTWVKVCREGGDKYIWSMRVDDNNWISFRFATNGCVILQIYDSGSTTGQLQSEEVFRDFSSWYHFVVRVNTNDSTANDRLRIYVNGNQINDFSTRTNLPSGYDIPITGNFQVATGAFSSQYNSDSLDGYLTDFNYCDNYSYAPTSFGETDSTTGEWKPIVDFTGVSYGNNGFRLKFENAAALGTDTSGNSNTLTVNNAGTNAKTVDTASNNFCTMNPLANKYPNSTFTLGNLAVAMGASQSTFNTGTFGVSSGKWYFEMKPTAMGSGTDNCLVGIVSRSDSTGTSDYLGEPNSVVYRNNGQYKKDSGNATYGASWTTSNIVMVAVDCDNNNIYFGTDNQWADGSGNNDEAAPNSAISFTSQMISDGVVFPTFGDLSTNSPEPAGQFNFGNSPFTISSGNADANGYGNFEYAPPTGYYALCTKNINQYG